MIDVKLCDAVYRKRLSARAVALACMALAAAPAAFAQTTLPTVEPEQGYVVKETTTATKTDTELRDIPQSITVRGIGDSSLGHRSSCPGCCPRLGQDVNGQTRTPKDEKAIKNPLLRGFSGLLWTLLDVGVVVEHGTEPASAFRAR